MKIAIGGDHASPALKAKVVEHLKANGHEVEDYGTYTKDAVDYPDFALKVAEAVASGKAERGVLICGTGIGISIAANKVKGIRCALCSDTFSAHATREHNDANMLCFGERVVGAGLALELVDAFINAEYMNSGNHVTRVAMLSEIEKEN